MSEKYLHVVERERLLLQEKKDFFASGFACCRHCAVQKVSREYKTESA